MSDIQNFQSEFIAQCLRCMEENINRIQICVDTIAEDEIWKKPNESSNSIGNLILHLCGNIRQYAISSLGNIPDTRQRSSEFSSHKTNTKAELMETISSTVKEAHAIIGPCGNSELLRIRTVQGFQHSGISIIIHITEHLSYHTGQIALLTKLIKNEDLGFYKGINLDIKNE
jgi:uncharacterized damage-inducible protein DinB